MVPCEQRFYEVLKVLRAKAGAYGISESPALSSPTRTRREGVDRHRTLSKTAFLNWDQYFSWIHRRLWIVAASS